MTFPILSGGLGLSVLESLIVKTVGSAGEIARKLGGTKERHQGQQPQNPNPGASGNESEGPAADQANESAQKKLAEEQANQVKATIVQQQTALADRYGHAGAKRSEEIVRASIDAINEVKMPEGVQAALTIAAQANDHAADEAKAVDAAAQDAKDKINGTGDDAGSSAGGSSAGGSADDGQSYDDGQDQGDDGYDDGDTGEEEAPAVDDTTAQPAAPPVDPSSLLGGIAPALGAAGQTAAAPFQAAADGAGQLGSALGGLAGQQSPAAPAEDDTGSESKRRERDDEDQDDDEDYQPDDAVQPETPAAAETPPPAAPSAEGDPGAGAVNAADSQADAPVDLPDGSKTPPVDKATAATMKAYMNGESIAEANQKNGRTIPAPGSVVLDPIPSAQRQPNDVAVYTDKHIAYLGNGKIWNNGVQDEKTMPEAGFLGWARPTPAPAGASGSPQAPAAAPAAQPVAAGAH